MCCEHDTEITLLSGQDLPSFPRPCGRWCLCQSLPHYGAFYIGEQHHWYLTRTGLAIENKGTRLGLSDNGRSGDNPREEGKDDQKSTERAAREHCRLGVCFVETVKVQDQESNVTGERRKRVRWAASERNTDRNENSTRPFIVEVTFVPQGYRAVSSPAAKLTLATAAPRGFTEAGGNVSGKRPLSAT